MKQILLVGGLVLGLTLSARAATYYVSTTGSDSNAGTEGAPFATVKKGLDAAKPGDEVRLGAGNFNEIVTTVRDGLAGQPIVLNGQNGATIQRLIIARPYHTVKNLTVSGYTNKF